MYKAKILVVEDEAIVAEDLSQKLSRLGYNVIGVTASGEQSLALARERGPDLVLMDIRLEGQMDGVEAAQVIRRECDVPVIYLTAHSDSATLQRAKVTEPFGYILKPFETAQLGTQIQMALHKHQAEREVHRQREWLRVTLQSIGDAVITTDAAGNVTSLNPVAEELTGWKTAEALNRPLTEVFNIINEETRRPAFNPVERVLREGKVVGLANHTALISRDGTERAIEDSAAPIKDTQGRILGAVMVFHDASEKRRAEEELKAAKVAAEQAQAVAEAASRAKDQFIAVLSHELRTPLTPALAAVSIMEADMRLPGDTREDLALVRRNIALEVRLIADLLDVSRIISGKLHLERRPMDVASAIREAAQIVSGDLDAKGQTLTIETPGSAYLTFGDAARLQQVFWNLLRNANKFTPHRGRIAVRTSVAHVDHCPLAARSCPVGMGDCPLPQASEGNSQPCGCNLTIEVTDNGSGVAPEVLPRLFNPFEQAEEARPFGGLGLGLSICKAVVEMHGGTIAAQSDGPGKGATFTVRLPIAQCPLISASDGSPVAAGGMQTAGSHGQPASPEQPQAVRILLVEDHADTAKLMKRLLMADGHEVIVVDSVAAGLAAVEQAAGKLDLLISDLGLPDGTGHDLMRQLLEQGKAMPGIALSGFGTPADIEKSKAAGFSEHLVKPTSPDLLAAAIQRAMASRHLAVFGGRANHGR